MIETSNKKKKNQLRIPERRGQVMEECTVGLEQNYCRIADFFFKQLTHFFLEIGTRVDCKQKLRGIT